MFSKTQAPLTGMPRLFVMIIFIGSILALVITLWKMWEEWKDRKRKASIPILPPQLKKPKDKIQEILTLLNDHADSCPCKNYDEWVNWRKCLWNSQELACCLTDLIKMGLAEGNGAQVNSPMSLVRITRQGQEKLKQYNAP